MTDRHDLFPLRRQGGPRLDDQPLRHRARGCRVGLVSSGSITAGRRGEAGPSMSSEGAGGSGGRAEDGGPGVRGADARLRGWDLGVDHAGELSIAWPRSSWMVRMS